MDVLEKTGDGFSERHESMMTHCDHSKAFNCVDHNLLVDKLNYYGIFGTPTIICCKTLTERQIDCFEIVWNFKQIEEIALRWLRFFRLKTYSV